MQADFDFNHRLFVKVIFQATILNICRFELLKCEDRLLFFVIYDGEWTLFVLRAWGKCDETFYRQNYYSINPEENSATQNSVSLQDYLTI